MMRQSEADPIDRWCPGRLVWVSIPVPVSIADIAVMNVGCVHYFFDHIFIFFQNPDPNIMLASIMLLLQNPDPYYRATISIAMAS